MKYKDPFVWIPLAISLAVVGGMLLGDMFTGKPYVADYDRKLNTILNLVADDYVDTVTISELVEKAVPKILTDLDPHTIYIPAKDLTAVNDELEGSFSGIGITFAIFDDTIRVTQVLEGGPSEKAGLQAGDRIVTIDDSTFVGSGLNLNEVRDKHLKGAKNTINITNTRFLENSIPLPKTEDEAVYIANALTRIQTKIDIEKSLLRSYEREKQYLLRQMFI